MKILLTGHEGYLGSRLHVYLKEQGHDVIGFGRQQDIGTLTRAMLDQYETELVIHCATAMDRTHTVYKVGSIDERVNVEGTRRLVQALAGTEIGLIHISTKDVYGEVYAPHQVMETPTRLIPTFTVNENEPFRPRTVYAKTKLMGEFIAESHPKTTIVRLSSGYTSQPHPRGNWVLHFCRTAKAGDPFQINGSGKQLRDLLHADDLGALALLLHEKNAWGYKLNAGGGMSSAYSVLEVLDMIAPRLPRKFHPGGDWGYISDNTLAGKLVGWKPARSFPAELRTLMERVRHE